MIFRQVGKKFKERKRIDYEQKSYGDCGKMEKTKYAIRNECQKEKKNSKIFLFKIFFKLSKLNVYEIRSDQYFY